MLTSVGVRSLRGFVRLSHGFLQRRRPVFCRIDETFLLQTSSLRHTIPSAFVKGLCTRIEEGSTRELCIGNDAEDVDSERRVETQVLNYENNNGVDSQNYGQNRQGKSLDADKKDSHFCSNIYSDKTSSAMGTNLKTDSTSPNNTDIIRESYPIADSPRFQLPADWKQNKENSPGIKFPDEIYVIKNHKDELEHKEILEQFLDEDVLGFDTEHCPVEHQVCVVQLATQDTAVLWQSTNFKKKMPSYLKEILTGRVAKVGHACVDDAIMICNQFNIEPVNLIDTYCWARDLHCSHKSLQGVCAIFLNEFLSKKHQRSDWKKANLSPGQIRYAATDAWISLRVYQEMKRHGEELGVTLTPIYKNLQQWQAEVKDNQRRRRKRRRDRLREQKQELLSQIESVKQNGHNISENNKTTTEQEAIPETLNKSDDIQNTDLEHEYESKVSITNEVDNGKTSDTTDNIHSEQDDNISDDVGDNDKQSKGSNISDDIADNDKQSKESNISDDVGDNDKQSKGSRRRTKKFFAKFHPLE